MGAKSPEYRWFDPQVNIVGNETSDAIKGMLARPRQSHPWVVIVTDTAMFEGPLPGNADDFLALLKKYGGP